MIGWTGGGVRRRGGGRLGFSGGFAGVAVRHRDHTVIRVGLVFLAGRVLRLLEGVLPLLVLIPRPGSQNGAQTEKDDGRDHGQDQN